MALALAVAVALAGAALGSDIHERGGPADSSEALARALRRQLVRDNYDYTPAESEEAPEPAPRRPPRRYRLVRKDTAADETPGGKERDSEHEYLMRSREVNEDKLKVNDDVDQIYDGSEPLDSHAVSGERDVERRRRVVLELGERMRSARRYKDGPDERVARRYIQELRNEHVNEMKSTADQADPSNPTTVHYSILKVRNPYRRSGDAATLIQEVAPGGVSLVSLGAGPVPPLALPPPRRQYRAGPRSLRDDHEEELPPPPADAAQPTQPTPPAYYQPLRMTITPNEILVL